MTDLTGKKIAFLVAEDGVEQVELTTPWEAVKAAGATPVLVAPKSGQIQARNHLDRGDKFGVDKSLDQADAFEFDALMLPGGVANPDRLRLIPKAVSFTKAFFVQGKPVAAICHAPWTLIEAEVTKGRTLTSWPSLRTDLTNSGASWVDQEVHVSDGPNTPNILVTSRKPADLTAFCDAMITAFATEPKDTPAGVDVRRSKTGAPSSSPT